MSEQFTGETRMKKTQGNHCDFSKLYYEANDVDAFVDELVIEAIADSTEFQSLSDYAEMAEEQIEELVDMLEKAVKTLDMISNSGVLGFGFCTDEANAMLNEYR